MKRLRLLLLFAIFLTLAPVSAFAATAGATKVADPSSASTWRNWGLENSTENVGRIWTDKTVSNGNIVLSGADGDMTIEKDDDSDFLTSLSAISSTSNLSMTSTTPLDIVLVLDASGSMDDPMGSNDSTKRIDALKAAANSFIDENAKKNDEISNADQRHRVAVVKFAGAETDEIGNDRYRSGGFTYNYSQTMKALTACTSSDASKLKDTVNSIRPAGATRADNGLSQASRCFSEPRSGAKKVVVFFTDGTPTSNRDFESGVASSAIASAKALKDAGATVYSVGIFEGANPSAEVSANGTSNENKFMQAVSSNYPDATYTSEWWGGWSWDFGARTTDADFYKSATSAADLKDVFDNISQDIVSAAGHPTEVVEGAENTSGYVTFTDQLGDYMKVDSFKSVVFAKKTFSDPEVSTEVSTSGKVDTYTFHGTAGNLLYPTGDLKDIIIRVERSDNARTGDKVTVSIPASLIPLRHFNVDEDAGTGNVTLTFPIRVFYESSLKEEAIGLLANPDGDMANYIASHTEDGKVYFLANAYSGEVDGVDGDTTSSFTPATGNSYYYITEDTPLYIDAECTQRAPGSLDSSATYYYKRSWYDIAGGTATKRSSVVPFPGSVAEGVTGAIATDESGYLILRKGSRRLTYINELKTSKGANATNTASTIINPHWSGRTINVALGNNGRISLEQPGTLAISKTVVVPAGFDENYYSNLDFTFNISIPGAAGKTFKATVKGKDGTAHGDTSWDLPLDAGGNATHTLKHGETLYVYGLPRGTTYTVTEEAANGFETSPTVPQEGTIEAGLEAKAEFTNKYSAKGTLSGRENLAGEKILDGRDWLANDSFTFILEGLYGAPMPEGAEGNISRIVVTSPEGTPSGTPVAFNFGDIAYNAPGTYTYQIYEPAEEAATPGVSTSLALYTVTVTVEDNHDGTLAASAEITRVHDDLGADVAADAAATNVARFTNTFDAASQDWAPIATKTLSDASGALPLQSKIFEFSLTPMDDAPMPAHALELVGRNNAHGVVVFEGITFTRENVGKTYHYKICEKTPADPRPGMTYDNTVWIATVEVSHENVDGKNVVKVSATYAREGKSESLDEAAFENSYTPQAFNGSGVIKGKKQLVGRNMLDTDDFNFSLNLVSGPENGVAWEHNLSLEREISDNVVNFKSGKMTFTKPGKYTFEISENAPAEDGAGITWDRHVATATVTIVDNNGTLDLGSVSYDNTTSAIDADKAVTDHAAFTNVYAPTEVAYYPGLTVSKVLTGRSMDMGMFSFTITGKDATAENGTVAATADEANALLADSDKSFSNTQRRASGIAEDMAKLSDVVFNAENANKTYAFEVAEVIPANENKVPGVAYDNSTHKVAISVIDNLNGTLTVKTRIDGKLVESDDNRRVLFENKYSADDATVKTVDFGLTKVLEGRDWQNGDSFTFLLEGVGGAPVPMGDDGVPSTSVVVGPNDVVDGAAKIDFGSIVYTQPGQYEYKVTEKRGSAGGMTYSDNVAVLRVTVRDNTETGELKASVERVSGDSEFVNTYDSSIPSDKLVNPHFSKVLEGRDWREGDEFSFTIKAKTPGAPLPVDANGKEVTSVTVHNATEAKSFTFGTIPFTYDMVRDGARKFEYEVTENASGIPGISDDKHAATVTVTVADQGIGTMSVVVENKNNVFKNTYSSQLDYTAAGGLSVTKKMNGRAMSAGEFGFVVTATGDGDKLGIAGEHANSAAPDGGEALVVSSPAGVTFTQEDVGKVYSYTITEKGGNLGGVSYDATSYNVEITTDDDASNARLTVTTRVTSTSGIDNTYTYVAGSDANAAAKVSFENSYAAARTTTSIVGTKSMTNGLMFDNDFKFRLAYGAGDRAVVSNATNVNGKVDFGTLSYDSDILEGLVGKGLATRTGSTWTIPYVAYEVTDGLGDRGVTPTASSFPFNVTVTDNGKGTLTCTTNLPTGGPAFRNTYATGESVSIELAGSKLLNVDDGLAGADIAGKFKFTVTGYDGAPMPERTTATNGANGNVGFGLITFTFDDLLKALGETPGTTDEAAEALDAPTTNAPEATPDVQTGEPASAAENFSDGAEPEDAAPKAAPEAEGEAPVAPDATESAPAAEPALEALANHDVEGDATATASWRRSRRAMRVVSDTVETDGADEAGSEPVRERSHTYRYDITESGSADGVTNDTQSTRTVYVKVTDNGRGSLTAAIVDEHGNVLSGPAFTFTNSYSVTPTTSSVTDQIKVHKTLTGRALDANEFTFELIEDGCVVATGTNDASGKVTLSGIEYTSPGIHNYTIREHGHGTTANGVTYSDATYRVTTTVKDNGDGTLDVTHKLVDADEAEFENVYTAKSTKLALTAAKVLEGADLKAGQFTFKLSGGGVELTATNDANGQVTFSELSFTQAGTYTFTISEVNDGQQGVTYDEAERKVTVTVEDDRLGNLIASVNQEELEACVFRNTYTKPEEPAKPTTPATPTKFVPQTGDPIESAPIVVSAVLGVAILAVALVVSKRDKRN